MVRDALLWNDTRSAARRAGADRRARRARRPGPTRSARCRSRRSRSPSCAGCADHEPEAAARTAAVCLPHDWLTWRLRGAGDARRPGHRPRRRQRHRLLVAGDRRLPPRPARARARPRRRAAPGPRPGRGRRARRPAARCSARAPATTPPRRSAWARPTGRRRRLDRHLGRRLRGVAEAPAADPTGIVAGFADATGRFLPLVATLNAARVLDSTARAARRRPRRARPTSRWRRRRAPAALVLVPYFEGERTPNRPDATGVAARAHPRQLRRRRTWPAPPSRACSAGSPTASTRCAAEGAPVERVLLVGGGAASPAVREIAPAVLGRPVHRAAAGRVRRARRRRAGGLGAGRRVPGVARALPAPSTRRRSPRACGSGTARPTAWCSTGSRSDGSPSDQLGQPQVGQGGARTRRRRGTRRPSRGSRCRGSPGPRRDWPPVPPASRT